ncbi:hypothetical protein DPMN_185824 [Dreissena polymorpha]|uniref:Uncharacterized protein n=1 Tax=Dreissena polymorpha TaxID=45954 RepID=A0A9D4I5Y3_DREPO|nr:hypothetical protein DPMN_185824 [Dreissena polymorpha]
MIKHGMDVIKQAMQYKNPFQTPVSTLDQPLYAIAKQIHWLLPEEYGERKYFIMMGGLHIEMAFFNVLVDWLYDSGWITAITTAGVATAGRADGIQNGASTSRGQWAHQVMVADLYILKCKAYKEYTERVTDSAEKLAVVRYDG